MTLSIFWSIRFLMRNVNTTTYMICLVCYYLIFSMSFRQHLNKLLRFAILSSTRFWDELRFNIDVDEPEPTLASGMSFRKTLCRWLLSHITTNQQKIHIDIILLRVQQVHRWKLFSDPATWPFSTQKHPKMYLLNYVIAWAMTSRSVYLLTWTWLISYFETSNTTVEEYKCRLKKR